MNIKPLIPLLGGLLLFGSLQADTGGVQSLRGEEALDAQGEAAVIKSVGQDKQPLARDFVHQPPLIPHEIRNYHIDRNSNKCLSCHSWSNARESGATRVSVTHFVNRDGKQLADMAPGRYFCTQCHVPQAEAKPLVNNRFQPVDALGRQ